ncbi:ABC transporter ATP-binding protein [Numidum massiliense]|uniref:ABC transporter ATP-binding protein n=1 Tax=Numidum massiliense TaxID=1522315 RepID=UPI0006D53904|nr:ABC transporter ATP-binding protein [Numidum massiliense]
MAENNLLEITNLSTGFHIDGKFYNAIEGINLSVKEKEVVCIVGESGCGKSVLSLSIMHLLPKHNGEISGGDIVFDGHELSKLSEAEMNKLRGKDLAMIFQEPMTALNPVFTIGSQLQEALFNHTDMSKESARERCVELLKNVGISRPERIMDEYPHQLSGGMRQRVMIAMAIALHPKLLIADEPTTAVDVTVQAQILELLKEIQEQEKMAILFITHDLGVVAEIADRVVVMYAGQIVEEGSVDKIFYDAQHPYTKALLSSIPRLDEEKEELNTIKGIVPPLTKLSHTSCRFADRCPVRMDKCMTEQPELVEISPGHRSRCLLNYPAGKVEV